MGRGSIKRDSKQYQTAAFIGKKLAEQDYILITGGGPGTMEATHLGAWFAGRKDNELQDAINILKKTTDIRDANYFKGAILVKKKYPRIRNTIDIAIPTFVYGVEFSNIFAHKYVLYFNNAIREETIVILSKNGIILLPGGYGTMIELFFALEYNSDEIKTSNKRPIILFNSKYWEKFLGPELLKRIPIVNSIQELFNNLNES
ncbi:MAG: LOG family protein [Legionellaceae bacterium]|nr:LOG family protein [Legionellaceae bacterium]